MEDADTEERFQLCRGSLGRAITFVNVVHCNLDV